MVFRHYLDPSYFKKLLKQAVIAPLLMTLLLALLFFWQIQNLRSTVQWVEHTDEVIAQTHHLQRLLIDAETGIRGYFNSKETIFLEPYSESIAKFPSQLQALKDLVQDNPSQEMRLQKLKEITNKWFQEAAIVKKSIDEGTAKYLRKDAVRRKNLMNETRDQFAEFIATEENLRNERSDKAESAAMLALISAGSITILLGLLISLHTRKAMLALSANYKGAIESLEKQANELHESREWFSTTLTSIGDAVIVVDTESKVTFLNPIAENLTGWKLADARGRPMKEVFNIINEATRLPAFNPVDRVLKEGIVVGLANHTVLIAKNKIEYPIEDSAAPIKSKGGTILGVVLVFRDVSQRHKTDRDLVTLAQDLGKAVEARNESLANLRTINEVGKNISAELDLEKLVQTVTDAATQLTRAKFGAFFYNVVNEKGDSYTLYSISGVPKETFSKFPMPRKTEIFAPTFEGTGIVRSDNIMKDPRYGKNAPHHGMPAGHLPVVSYLAVPVISRSGETLGGLFFGHPDEGIFTQKDEDLIKGLASQAAVAIDNAQLFKRSQEAIKARDEFLSIASHELKTPLTSLKLQLQLTQKNLNKQGGFPLDKLSHTLGLCLDQTQRLSSLVEDLLDASRIQSGQLTYEFQEEDLTSIVNEAVERLSEQFTEAKCPVEIISTGPIILKCDRFRIDQVVVNLLTNTLKYGAGKPVKIEVKKEDAEAVVSIMDHGIGITAEDQKTIFERFARAVDATNISGLGLGLYISRQIVLAHEGKIEVESELNKGSTFTVRLPLDLPSSKNLSAGEKGQF